MALIQLTPIMTDQEEREVQNSNNHYLNGGTAVTDADAAAQAALAAAVGVQTAINNTQAAADAANLAATNTNAATANVNAAITDANTTVTNLVSNTNATVSALVSSTNTNTNTAISNAQTATTTANTAADRANTAAAAAEGVVAGELDPAIDSRIAAKTNVAGGVAGYDYVNTVVSNASFISTTDGSNVQAKLDLDNKTTTYTCTTTGTVHALVPVGGVAGSNGKFLADASFVGGDTFTVGGTAKTATTQNGAVLDDSYFTSGNWVNFNYDGAKLNFKSGGGSAIEVFNFKLFIQPESTPPTAEKAGDLWVHHALATDFTNIVLDDAVKVSYTNGSLMLIVDDTNNGSDNITQTKNCSGTKIPFTSHRDTANDTVLPWQAGSLNKSGNIIDIKRKYPLVYSRLNDVLDLETASIWDGTQWVLLCQQGSYLAVGTTGAPYSNLYNRAGSNLTLHSAIPSFPSAQVNAVKNSLNGIDTFYGLNASPWLVNVQRSGDTPAIVALTVHTSAIVNDISISKSGVYAVVVHTHAIDVYKKSSGTWTYLSTILTDATNTFYGCDWRPDDSEITVTKSVTPFALRMKRTGDAFAQLANPTTLPTAACYKCKYSPDGKFVAFRTGASPCILCYKITSDTVWDKIANPATLPAVTGNPFTGLCFSTQYLITSDSGNSRLLFYTYTDSGLVYVTSFSLAQALPLALSLDGTKLGVGLGTSPWFAWYSLSGTALTPLTNPTTMPTSQVYTLDFIN